MAETPETSAAAGARMSRETFLRRARISFFLTPAHDSPPGHGLVYRVEHPAGSMRGPVEDHRWTPAYAVTFVREHMDRADPDVREYRYLVTEACFAEHHTPRAAGWGALRSAAALLRRFAAAPTYDTWSLTAAPSAASETQFWAELAAVTRWREFLGDPLAEQLATAVDLMYDAREDQVSAPRLDLEPDDPDAEPIADPRRWPLVEA